MTDLSKLEKSMKTEEFYKKVFPGVFFDRIKRKDCYNLFNSKATSFGVADNVVLREIDYEGFRYRIVAFSIINEDIPKALVNELKEFTGKIPDNQIRYEAHGTGKFFTLFDYKGNTLEKDYVIIKLTKQFKSIYFDVFSGSKQDKLDCPVSAYVIGNKSVYVWPMRRKTIIEYL